ncbi:hypothetical protein [Halorubrum sp. Boch-26]|uniref:hypothetical protein n=1 Tax=Halorubrum sp. Boch-26 TaxID=2994426 RepID=UPI0024689526|nr:hypothetical protein [Halorubrum sp. Boch-26]
MPSIHVSDWVFEEIEKRLGEDESPTDVLRRILQDEQLPEDRMREIAQEEIQDFARNH